MKVPGKFITTRRKLTARLHRRKNSRHPRHLIECSFTSRFMQHLQVRRRRGNYGGKLLPRHCGKHCLMLSQPISLLEMSRTSTHSSLVCWHHILHAGSAHSTFTLTPPSTILFSTSGRRHS
ncbi:hypothetical protein P692DRAFT_20784400 [Suillus brevipes Sb2]|nr:hypothetical protein P692DRAFT_20784400 [Suillus brevipes Sb2]